MAEGGSQGLGDLLAMFGGNPLTAVAKNIENFRKGVESFMSAVQAFTRTMETMDNAARRITSLLDEVEAPIRTLMPQVTNATKQSLALFEQLSGPLDRVTPGIERLADTLGSPTLTGMPNVLGDFIETMTDVASRMRPLSQLAEAAGSMFGIKMPSLRLPGSSSSSSSSMSSASASPPPPPPPPASPPIRSSATPVPAKKAPAKKAAAKKTGTKKPTAKKSSGRK